MTGQKGAKDRFNADERRKKNNDPTYTMQLTTSLVLAYELVHSHLIESEGILFHPRNPGASWACFVYNNRKGISVSEHASSYTDKVRCTEHNIDLKYKFAFGPVADKKLNDRIYLLENKATTFDNFLGNIKLNDMDQLSFHCSILANQCLKLIGEVESSVEARKIIRTYSV